MDPSPRLAGALLAAALAALPSRAVAQIVNVQPLIAAKDRREGFGLALEGSADIRSGNTRLMEIAGSLVAQYRSGRHLGFVLAKGDFGEKDGDPFVAKDLEHARYRVDLRGPLQGEVFVQHDRDDFRRLGLRAIAGLGPRVRLTPFAGFEAAIGAGYMLEYERLSYGPEADAGTSVLDHRLTSYLYLSTMVLPKLTLGDTMYFQPRLDRFSDLRVLNEASLLGGVTDHLSMKLTLASAYDSEPPIGVVPLDSTFKGSLQVSF